MKLNLSAAPHVHSPQSTRALMLNVIIALLPCAVFGVVRFGANALILLAVATLSAVLAECVWQKLSGRRVLIGDLSAAVTGLILGLNLPPYAPWWLAVVGSAFAVVVVKGLFGGLGDNFINPALAGRALLLASWPRLMASWWAADAVSGATPLADPSAYSLKQLLLGDIPGTIGEVCKLAILAGFIYLLVTQTISWRIPVSMVASAFVFSWLFGRDPVASVLSGGLMFGAVFMATDYVTCPMAPAGQIIYAALAGLLVAVVRCFGSYPEGVTFAILLMNAAAPLIDRSIRRRVYGHAVEGRKQNA